MNIKHGLILLLTLIIVSCYVAPRSVFIVQPSEDTGIWLMGKQYFHAKTDDFKIALAFDKMDYSEYQFHIEITNISNKSILVAPENFSIIASISQRKEAFCDTIIAIDPEYQILETYKDQSREYAAYETEVGTQTLFSFIDLISDIASIGDPKTDEDILQDENDDLQRQVDELQTDLDHERNVKSLNTCLSKWETKALRKTTLPGGYLIRGKIYFPLIKDASSLDIHINIIDEDIVFKYIQFEEKVK